MDDQKQQVAARVKEANNILVTVSANPSVDQLAACIGLTLALNKMGKHATAVFSGAVPSTIEFLQPEKTIEKNTDSLRDFIIALDKSKADKLRYKVEDTVVKIFITPYRTSISQKDLEFSQGDFNVDVVLAIGVHNQAELDQAITSHGRILHDATVVTMNTKPGGELGSINWLDPTSSSLSELTVQLVDLLDKNLLDTQIATAMLTGIVAETDRFSNNKTTPRTMTLSAELMTAGANQQLVATKLEAPAPPPPAPAAPIATADHHDEPQPIIGDHEAPAVKKSDDGTLEIVHDPKAEEAERAAAETKEHTTEAPQADAEPSEPAPTDAEPTPEPAAQPAEPAPAPEPTPEPEPEEPKAAPQIHIDEHGSLSPLGGAASSLPSISHHDQSLRMATTPPSLGGQLNASDMPESYEPSVDPLTQATLGEGEAPAPPLPEHPSDTPPVGLTVTPPTAAPTADESTFSMPYEALESEPPATGSTNNEFDGLPLTPRPDETLTEIEQEVQSPHLNQINALAAAQPPSQPEIEPDLVLPGTDQAPAVTLPAPSTDASFTLPPQQPIIPEPAVPMPPADSGFTVPDPTLPPAADATTDNPADTLDSARDAVMDALNASADPNSPLPPVAALNAQPVDLQLGGTPPALDPAPADANDYGMAPMTTVQPSDSPAYNPAPAAMPAPAWSPAAAPFQPPFTNGPGGDNPALGAAPDMPTPAQPYDPANPAGLPQVQDPNAPPPVPPPMMPPTPPYNQPY